MPQTSSIAVIVLALGVGANTAMFSAVNHLSFRPLPFTEANRLVRIRDAVKGTNGALRTFNMSARNVLALREHAQLFDGVIAFSPASMTLVGGDTSERVSVVFQTDG